MFSEKLKTLRENANLLQKELACELNVTSQTISGWEIGRTTPDYETLVKIAKYFQVSTDFLLNNNSKQNNLEAKINNYEILKELLINIGYYNKNDNITEKALNNIIEFLKANKKFLI